MPFLYPPELAEQTAWALELGVLATVLAALAWLILVVGSTCGLRTKALAALPGLLTLGLAGYVAGLIDQSDRNFDSAISMGVLIELLTVVAVVVICMDEPIDGLCTAALIAVAWGSTALAGLHQVAEYAAMSTFSDANWDVPPGTGFLTAAGLLISGLITLAYAVPGRPARPRIPQLRPLADQAA